MLSLERTFWMICINSILKPYNEIENKTNLWGTRRHTMERICASETYQSRVLNTPEIVPSHLYTSLVVRKSILLSIKPYLLPYNIYHNCIIRATQSKSMPLPYNSPSQTYKQLSSFSSYLRWQNYIRYSSCDLTKLRV